MHKDLLTDVETIDARMYEKYYVSKFKKEYGAEQPVEGVKSYIHTRHKLLKEPTINYRNFISSTDDLPIYDVVEPETNKDVLPLIAFSILEDEKVTDGLTVLALGINPKGKSNEDDDNTARTVSDQMEKAKSITIPDATRRNALLRLMCSNLDGGKPIKRLVQADLYTKRTENAGEVNSVVTEENLTHIYYWFKYADYIYPSLGSSFLDKFKKQKKYKEFMDNITKYKDKIIFSECTKAGVPLHSSRGDIYTKLDNKGIENTIFGKY